jgi:hypothetical protein
MKRKNLIDSKQPAYEDGRINRPLTKLELSDYSQWTPRSLEREVEKGNLVAVRIGARDVRFRPEDIRAWLAKNPVSPDDPGYFHGTRPQDRKAKVGA